MSTCGKSVAGSITWADLTVPDAEPIKDFYSQVVGWKTQAVNMGKYDDYNMELPGTHEAIAGICHSRGINAHIPAQWLIYIHVADIEESVRRCLDLGGKVLVELKGMSGYGRYCVIQDPAGAAAALFELAPEP